MKEPNKTRQPMPVERPGSNRRPAARHGCAERWAERLPTHTMNQINRAAVAISALSLLLTAAGCGDAQKANQKTDVPDREKVAAEKEQRKAEVGASREEVRAAQELARKRALEEELKQAAVRDALKMEQAQKKSQ